MKKAFLAVVFLGVMIVASLARADTIYLDTVLAGSPTGTAPWAWADLEPANAGIQGKVIPSTLIRMQSNLGTASQSMSRWYFDLAPERSFDDILDFTGLSSGRSSTPEGEVRLGTPVKTPPGSDMDFYFDFTLSAEGDPFGQDDWSEWGVVGVSPSDFAASRIELEGPSGTSLIAGFPVVSANPGPPVPEPATMLLVGAGFGLVGWLKRHATVRTA